MQEVDGAAAERLVADQPDIQQHRPGDEKRQRRFAGPAGAARLPYQDERQGQQRVRHQESEAGAPAIAEPPEENALHGLMRTRKSRP